MSVNEQDRLDVFGRVKRCELSVAAAAGLLGISERQAWRIKRRFDASGAQGLVHAARGRPSNRRLPDDLRDRIVKLHQEHYADFGPTLACEKLAGTHAIDVSTDTLTNLLKERGLWERRRRRGRHRRRRERRRHFGSMVQIDASLHDWFEGRAGQGKCVLFTMIDDATGVCLARLYPAETTDAAFDLFERWAKRHGLPRSVYADRHAIYRDPDDRERATQFGRALGELGVKLICANSPQAKGRVERRHAVFQDRFVKELRLRKIHSMSQANALLDEGGFVDEVNAKFAVKARCDDADLHRAAPTNLSETLCVHERRVVGNDWCVRWRNRWLQIDASHASLRLTRKTVLVKSVRGGGGGEPKVEYEGQRLTWCACTTRPKAEAKPKAKAKAKAIVNNREWKPGRTHPWSAHPATARRAG